MTEDGIAGRARALAEALADGDFARVRVRDGETEIELRRARRTVAAAATTPSEITPAAAAEGPRPADVLSSDVVGIVRFGRPAPVEGTELDGDRELAFIEVLGIRNPVRSRGAGRIATVFVADGQAVEYGQPLFAVER